MGLDLLLWERVFRFDGWFGLSGSLSVPSGRLSGILKENGKVPKGTLVFLEMVENLPLLCPSVSLNVAERCRGIDFRPEGLYSLGGGSLRI